jgi:hypothetical protein
MLFDSISIRDNTLFDMARIRTGVPDSYSEEYFPGENEKFVNITKEELWSIIRHMKQTTEGATASLTRNQSGRSRGLWESGYELCSTPGGVASGTVFLN